MLPFNYDDAVLGADLLEITRSGERFQCKLDLDTVADHGDEGISFRVSPRNIGYIYSQDGKAYTTDTEFASQLFMAEPSA